jgi:hypothetical protein
VVLPLRCIFTCMNSSSSQSSVLGKPT